MNASHEVGWVWWAPGRCATRSVHAFLRPYGFEEQPNDLPPAYPGRPDGYTHNIGIPAGCETYPVIMQVRNPYSRLVSMWRLECMSDHRGPIDAEVQFAEFASTRNSLDLSVAYRTRVPDLLIRYETLVHDVAVLPFVDLADPPQRSMYDRHILSNAYAGGCMPDWRSNYDQRIADMVYDLSRAAFQDLGYSKDSWRAGHNI